MILTHINRDVNHDVTTIHHGFTSLRGDHRGGAVSDASLAGAQCVDGLGDLETPGRNRIFRPGKTWGIWRKRGEFDGKNYWQRWMIADGKKPWSFHWKEIKMTEVFFNSRKTWRFFFCVVPELKMVISWDVFSWDIHHGIR